jgi:uncharacterized protein YukE
LARQFARTADEGQLAQARLGRLAGQWGQQGWTGKAVRAFQSRLDRLPAHLQKLTDSYQAAADATLTYARAVEDIAEQTSLVKGRLALAEQDHAAAVAAQAALRPELALPTAGIDPLLIARQRAAEDAITQAADQLRLQTRELGLLAEERRAADQRMLSALRESSHVGMHNASGWSHAWQHVSTDVKHWTDNTLHAVDDAIDTAVNVGRYYWQHPDQARDAALDVAEIIGGAALDGLAFTGGGAAIAATGGAATPLVVPAVGAAVIATTDLMLNATNDLNHNLNQALTSSPSKGGSSSPPPSDSEWPKLSGMLHDASTGKGNFGVGSATRSDCDIVGRAWVGPGAELASDGKTWVSGDGLRVYRPPTYKPRLGRWQANLESKLVRGGRPISNGH